MRDPMVMVCGDTYYLTGLLIIMEKYLQRTM